MNKYQIEIPLKLPSLNDYVRICRANKQYANKFKQEYDTLTNRAMIVAYEMVYSKYKEIIGDDNNG